MSLVVGPDHPRGDICGEDSDAQKGIGDAFWDSASAGTNVEDMRVLSGEGMDGMCFLDKVVGSIAGHTANALGVADRGGAP